MKLKNEIYFSYGLAPAQPLGNILEEIFISVITWTDKNTNNIAGPFTIGYKRNIDMNFSSGIIYSYLTYNTTAKVHNENAIVYTEDFIFHSIMLREDIVYVTNKWVQMYSGMGVGFSFLKGTRKYEDGSPSEKLDETKLAYQISLFGLRAGHSFGGFFEIGYGYTGVLNLGVTWKF